MIVRDLLQVLPMHRITPIRITEILPTGRAENYDLDISWLGDDSDLRILENGFAHKRVTHMYHSPERLIIFVDQDPDPYGEG